MNTMEINDELKSCIERLLQEQLTDTNHDLNEEEKRFIVNSLLNFVHSATFKYIKGSIEHGGDFLHSRDHKQELYNELLDSFWYSAADKYKQAR